MIDTSLQHVHTEPYCSDKNVLDKALRSLPEGISEVFLDVKEIKKSCDCEIPPGYKTWVVIFYRFEDAVVG